MSIPRPAKKMKTKLKTKCSFQDSEAITPPQEHGIESAKNNTAVTYTVNKIISRRETYKATSLSLEEKNISATVISIKGTPHTSSQAKELKNGDCSSCRRKVSNSISLFIAAYVNRKMNKIAIPSETQYVLYLRNTMMLIL